MNEFCEINSEAMKAYDKDGFFILKKFLAPSDMEYWERTIIQKYALQALKIGAMRERLKPRQSIGDFLTVDDLDDIVVQFEEIDKKAGYFASLNVSSSIAARRFLSNYRLVDIAEKVLNCPAHLLEIPFGYPAMMLNVPFSNRMIYDWHTEHNYMPQRQNFTTLWIPTFRGKRDGNGTMGFRVGSHKKHYYHINVDKPEVSIKQRAIPEPQLADFPPLMLQCDPGDIVVFHGNLVHTGTLNQSEKPSYVTIVRIYDYRQDLTLSSAVNAGCGSEDYGREDLVLCK